VCDNSRHEWVLDPFHLDNEPPSCTQSDEHLEINAHRNLRGPYTAAIEIVLRLLDHPSISVLENLFHRHQLTLLLVCPELANSGRGSPEVRKWLTFSGEGNPSSRTLSLAHGLTDFILDCAVHLSSLAPLVLSIDNVDFADPLDQEFLAVLLRRAHPGQLKVKIRTSSDRLHDQLLTAVQKFVSLKYPQSCQQDLLSSKNIPAIEQLSLAKEYVWSDCTSNNRSLKSSYTAMTDDDRRELHQERLAELQALGQTSFSLGAIPFHCEQAGDDPAPLLAASVHCMHGAFYEAALDWAVRGHRMLAPTDQTKLSNDLSRNILFSLMLLKRLDELETVCARILEQSKDPALLAHTTYAKAILGARLYEPSRRDYAAAQNWINKSMAFTEMLPPSETRAVNIAFLRNTMALVKMRTGDLDGALQLLSDSLQFMATEAPTKFESECAILLHNRARLHIKRNEVPKAIDDLTTLLGHQPGNYESYFDRGVLRQRSGRPDEALRDFDAAIEWSPPDPEAHFNRAQALLSLSRPDEALAGYTRVLDLQPSHVEALTDRARLFYIQGKLDDARSDVNAALLLSPASARLLCISGLLEMANQNLQQAYGLFTKAIEVDSSLPDAWANRATVLFKQDKFDQACLDLTRSLSLREDSATFYNRGRCFEMQKKWSQAATDYSRALQLVTGDVRHIHRHLAICQQAEMAVKQSKVVDELPSLHASEGRLPRI
jgi:tetratricopeptide (TPR) repeat protein